MGGGIRVESVYKQGSTFFLDIPRISHEDAMEKISEAGEAKPTITKESGHRLSIEQEPQDFEATVIESTPQPQPQPQPTIAPTAQPAEVVMPQTIEVTQTSGASLEFKIPEQFQNLPFQEMSLADLDSAVRTQPVFENSGFQPLNILPDPVPEPVQITQQPIATTYPQPQAVQQPSPQYAQFDQTPRTAAVSVPPRVQQ